MWILRGAMMEEKERTYQHFSNHNNSNEGPSMMTNKVVVVTIIVLVRVFHGTIDEKSLENLLSNELNVRDTTPRSKV